MNRDDTDFVSRSDPIVQRAAALPPMIEPDFDLWPAISDQLAPRDGTAADDKPGRVPAHWTRVAAALALMAVSSAATWWWVDGRFALTPAETLAALEDTPAYVTALYRPGPETVALRSNLLVSLEANLAELTPRTRRVVTNNLLEIQRSLAQIHTALESDPGNASLQQLLNTTYRQELTILADLNQMADTFGANRPGDYPVETEI